jgi:hypothetical protein
MPVRPETFFRRRGFTLVEVLLAFTLLTALLLTLNMFVLSMGEIWGRNREKRLFEQHVRAVSRYVEGLLRRAAQPPAESTAVGAAEIRLPAGGSEGLLTFELPVGDRRLVWPDHPLPDVRCALAARAGQGLVLYWQSHLELKFAEDPPRATVLSPFVTGLDYDYLNPNYRAWQSQPVLQRDAQGRWQTPARLRLHFQHGEYSADTAVNVPRVTEGLPPF